MLSSIPSGVATLPGAAEHPSGAFGDDPNLTLDAPRHLYHFGPEALGTLLATSGFGVIRRWHQELEYDLFGWVQSTLNTAFRVPNVLFDSLTGRPRRDRDVKPGQTPPFSVPM